MRQQEKVAKEAFLPDYSQHLPRSWFQRSTEQVARELVGTYLIVAGGEELLAVRIVETEAYLAENDAACHAANRKTARNAPMFEAGGILYVYTIYGIHRCINIVTEEEGRGCAVLIRAAEPIAGTDSMMQRRFSGKEIHAHELLRGPGNLAKGMGFGLEHNHLPCYSEQLWIQPNTTPTSPKIITTTRIGISKSAELPLRFYAKGSDSVSATRHAEPLVR